MLIIMNTTLTITKYSIMKLGLSYLAFNGEELLPFALKPIRNQIDFVSVVYQTTSYYGELADPNLTTLLTKLQDEGLVDKLIHFESDHNLKRTLNEMKARNVGLEESRKNGCTHHISADVDEFYIPDQLEFAKKEMEDYDASAVSLINYFKKPTFRIVPNRKYEVSFIHTVENDYNLGTNYPYRIDITRKMNTNKCRTFEMNEFVIHHMTFVRKNIRSKLANSTNKVKDLDDFVEKFDKYQLGDRLRIPPDFINRRTKLVDNIFEIPEEL